MTTTTAAADDSAARLLRIYAYYRFALSILLLLGYFVLRREQQLVPFLPLLYLGTAIPYAALNLATLAAVLARPRRLRPRHYFLMLVLDIAALVLITHASGGIGSGFAILLLVTVAAAAIFVPGQIATLAAAVASLGVLGETVVQILARGGETGALLPAGLLGILLFASSVLMQWLAGRLRHSQELALEKTGEVLELQRLNQLIVQRMRTGILFVDAADQVKIANDSAGRLLGNGAGTAGISALPRAVADSLHAWRRNPLRSAAPLRLGENGPMVQLAFTRLEGPSGVGTLVFAEDFSQIAQQAQQLKLASLGRLTASIAHEIRNPLASISHAAQLLRESPELLAEDSHLVEIVLTNAQRTNEVIESVLTLSRGQQPQPELIALGRWLGAFGQELQLRDGGEAVTIELDVQGASLEARVDPTHLRQVMANLCENGLRYSLRHRGAAWLRLALRADPVTGLAQLDVIDRGEGVPEEAVSSIFEPFFTTEHNGTGLGLYLARELCEANQIRLEYLRDPEGGSCFRLNFPHPDRRMATVGTARAREAVIAGQLP